MKVEKEKVSHSGFEPISFERPSSRAYWYSQRWSRELPDRVRLGVEGLRAMNRTLEPEIVEQASRAVLERLCAATDAVVHVSSVRAHKKQFKGFIAYSDSIWNWDRALEVRLIKSSRVHRQLGALSVSPMHVQSAEPLLRDLEAMSKEEDEPDFLNRPTPFAYETAEKLIRGAYSHYVGSAPLATLGPDGDGGVIAEWQSDQRIVRLIVAPNENAKTYIYRRANNESAVDHVPSEIVLALRLRTVFG